MRLVFTGRMLSPHWPTLLMGSIIFTFHSQFVCLLGFPQNFLLRFTCKVLFLVGFVAALVGVHQDSKLTRNPEQKFLFLFLSKLVFLKSLQMISFSLSESLRRYTNIHKRFLSFRNKFLRSCLEVGLFLSHQSQKKCTGC